MKEDARQRVRVPVERREALLNEFEQSALSAPRFARLVGIKYSTFANWVARRRKQRAAVPEVAAEDRAAGGSAGRRVAPLRLFEAVVGEGRVETLRSPLGEGLVVELPGGSRVVIGSPMQLPMVAELVTLLAQGAVAPLGAGETRIARELRVAALITGERPSCGDAADAGTDGATAYGWIPRVALAELTYPGLISFTPLGCCASREWGWGNFEF